MRRLIFLLAMPSLATAADPQVRIEGPTTVTSGNAIVLDAGKSVSDKPLVWKLKQPGLHPIYASPEGAPKDAPKNSLAIILTPPPGTYEFTVIARDTPEKGDEKVDAASYVVTVESPNPATPLSPLPEPLTPAVVSGTLFVSVIYDPSAIPEVAAAQKTAKIRSMEGLLNFRYLTYDVRKLEPIPLSLSPYIVGSTDINRRNLGFTYINGIRRPAVGYPALVIQDQWSRVISVERAPADSETVVGRVLHLRMQ